MLPFSSAARCTFPPLEPNSTICGFITVFCIACTLHAVIVYQESANIYYHVCSVSKDVFCVWDMRPRKMVNKTVCRSRMLILLLAMFWIEEIFCI